MVSLGETINLYTTAITNKGGEDMQNTTERRQEMLEYLCEKRFANISDLMFKFKISRSTVIRDLQVLSISKPIFCIPGRYGGGVHIAKGFYIGRKYLKPNQKALLEKLSNSLQGEELRILQEILKAFVMPEIKRRK